MNKILSRYFPFFAGIVSSAILYAAISPLLRWKYGVFLVPAIWAVVALRKPAREGSDAAGSEIDEKPKKRGFFSRLKKAFTSEFAQLWAASYIFWFVMVYWVSYPSPWLTLGLIALAGYLAFYLPIYIALCRAMNTVSRLPIWVVSPICWVAIEWTRNRVLGGFSFAGLSHAIYDVPELVQLAEPLGEYGVNAAIVLVGALIGCALVHRWNSPPNIGGRRSVRLISLAAICLFCMVLYGQSRIQYYNAVEMDAKNYNRPVLKIGLLQDATPYRFPPPTTLNKEVSDKYRALALEASKQDGGYDLLVWPEGCCDGFFFDSDRDLTPLIDSFDSGAPIAPEKRLTKEELVKEFPKFAALQGVEKDEAELDLLFFRNKRLQQRRSMLKFAAKLNSATLLGIASAVFDETGNTTSYNSAILVPNLGSEKQVEELTRQDLSQSPTFALLSESASEFRRYSKEHLVMFGEYIPFLKYLPDSWELKSVCAECVLGRGEGPSAFRVSPRGTDVRFLLAPNVCFESSIPHLIKRQIATCREVDGDPDVLVNISHDGWFRCGIQTDMHLATHVFRAVENRRNVVSATHGGFSAWVDPCGRIRSKGTRGNTEIVPAEVYSIKIKRQGLYDNFDLGETWSLICAIVSGLCWLAAFALRIFLRRKASK